MPRTTCLSLVLMIGTLAAPPTVAQDDAPSLAQMLDAIAAAPRAPQIQDRIGSHVRDVILAADARARQSGTKIFCVPPGQGRFDAMQFRAFALAQVPTEAGRNRTTAASVIIDFVKSNYPCS